MKGHVYLRHRPQSSPAAGGKPPPQRKDLFQSYERYLHTSEKIKPTAQKNKYEPNKFPNMCVHKLLVNPFELNCTTVKACGCEPSIGQLKKSRTNQTWRPKSTIRKYIVSNAKARLPAEIIEPCITALGTKCDLQKRPQSATSSCHRSIKKELETIHDALLNSDSELEKLIEEILDNENIKGMMVKDFIHTDQVTDYIFTEEPLPVKTLDGSKTPSYLAAFPASQTQENSRETLHLYLPTQKSLDKDEVIAAWQPLQDEDPHSSGVSINHLKNVQNYSQNVFETSGRIKKETTANLANLLKIEKIPSRSHPATKQRRTASAKKHVHTTKVNLHFEYPQNNLYERPVRPFKHNSIKNSEVDLTLYDLELE
ncbi:uncharacterized protein LOC103187701 isoform X2 [Callorhinchus milii]|uniref:uncharacterized protein LOC103187701 isoform X2 n=1 Tax=Callorhinchus milii TaxID=7868 RepID=UPI001C3F870C|nr:uncharacterized protein LOC103187701 isoform X2 [Callorhinchus milii]